MTFLIIFFPPQDDELSCAYFLAAAAACNFSSRRRSFLSAPMKPALSADVWKRPCPSFELVSMNLRLIVSRAERLVCTKSDFLKVMIRFLAPMQQPLIMRKSLLTSP